MHNEGEPVVYHAMTAYLHKKSSTPFLRVLFTFGVTRKLENVSNDFMFRSKWKWTEITYLSGNCRRGKMICSKKFSSCPIKNMGRKGICLIILNNTTTRRALLNRYDVSLVYATSANSPWHEGDICQSAYIHGQKYQRRYCPFVS